MNSDIFSLKLRVLSASETWSLGSCCVRAEAFWAAAQSMLTCHISSSSQYWTWGLVLKRFCINVQNRLFCRGEGRFAGAKTHLCLIQQARFCFWRLHRLLVVGEAGAVESLVSVAAKAWVHSWRQRLLTEHRHLKMKFSALIWLRWCADMKLLGCFMELQSFFSIL